MQHGFVDEGASLEVAAARDIIPHLASLIEAFRTAGLPVVFTEFVYADNVPCFGVCSASGGVIFICAPDIIFLADRDGDGKAEVRE